MPQPFNLVKTPKDFDALNDLIKDMRGTQSDLAIVAIMGWNLCCKAHGTKVLNRRYPKEDT